MKFIQRWYTVLCTYLMTVSYPSLHCTDNCPHRTCMASYLFLLLFVFCFLFFIFGSISLCCSSWSAEVQSCDTSTPRFKQASTHSRLLVMAGLRAAAIPSYFCMWEQFLVGQPVFVSDLVNATWLPRVLRITGREPPRSILFIYSFSVIMAFCCAMDLSQLNSYVFHSFEHILKPLYSFSKIPNFETWFYIFENMYVNGVSCNQLTQHCCEIHHVSALLFIATFCFYCCIIFCYECTTIYLNRHLYFQFGVQAMIQGYVKFLSIFQEKIP